MVLDVLHSLELRIENVVYQFNDGATKMTGKEKGGASRMQEVSPKAICIHYYGSLTQHCTTKYIAGKFCDH